MIFNFKELSASGGWFIISTELFGIPFELDQTPKHYEKDFYHLSINKQFLADVSESVPNLNQELLTDPANIINCLCVAGHQVSLFEFCTYHQSIAKLFHKLSLKTF